MASSAYRHVEYSHELWWQFALDANAPRFLRATAGTFGLALIFAGARLLSPRTPAREKPTTSDIEDARALVAASPLTYAHLALVGDKALLFSEDRSAFLMYGNAGRSWISLGDPVGAQEEAPDLVWRLHELADRHGGYAAHYQVSAQALPMYLDLGLGLRKVGEEASVELAEFSLQGQSAKGLRSAVHRIQREGNTLRVVPADDVAQLLPGLRSVSDAWLQSKHAREKGFSLGFFKENYLRGLPVAVVEREGTLLGFANLWLGAEKEELSVDLMRYRPDAPAGVMDFLFAELMMWGKEQGYRRFNLGMAPFSGFEKKSSAPLWNRLALLLYQHGEHFYNFQGLRSYKAKFHPRWSPKFLAAPRGLALARVLTDLTALVSGSLKGALAA